MRARTWRSVRGPDRELVEGDERVEVNGRSSLWARTESPHIDDEPTGTVVGQQPFGGARMSGTNDKAGSSLNLLRWISPRTIKETFVPPTDWRYPYLG